LGVITKGVGFLPLLMIPAWVAFAGRGRAHPLSAGQAFSGLVLLLAAIAVWVVPMIIVTTASGDPGLIAYRDEILLRQTAERYVDAWGHHRPWHYYLSSVLPWAWLPLVLALPWAAPNWWRRLRRGDSRTLLPLSGVLLMVVFFSLSSGKRGVYMTPTAPLLVWAMAPLLPGLLARRGLNWLASAVLLLLGGSFLLIGLLGWAGLESLVRQAERYELQPWGWMSLVGASAVVLIAWLRPRRGMAALAAWLGVVWLCYSTFGYRDMDSTRSPRDMMQEVAAVTGEQAWLGLPDFGEEFVLQARQPVVHFGYSTPAAPQFRRAFSWLAEAPGQRWLLVAHEHAGLIECVSMPEVIDLGFQNSQNWWLVPGKAARSCPGDEAAAPLYTAPTTL
ncbi:MAG: hypothetical protein ACOCSR_05765, partial [Wenzhouxiangella sp.]